MKLISKFLVLFFGITTTAVIAQKADSVIVIYQNQKTIIPLPASGSQSSVSYADSNKVVEIGVWVRKPNDPSPFLQPQPNDLASGNPKKSSKWFSEVEAGYIKKFTSSHGEWTSSSTNGAPPMTFADTNSRSDRKGYQIRLSVLESEYYLTNKSSIISAFKLGFSQSNMQAHSYGNVTDSIGNVLRSFDDNYKFRINSFQFLYQFGYSYHFNTGKLPARINVGNSFGILLTSTKLNNQQTYGRVQSNGSVLSASLLQPYLGMEIGKIGILFSADLALPNSHYYIFHSDLGGNISMALTYRIF